MTAENKSGIAYYGIKAAAGKKILGRKQASTLEDAAAK